MFETLPKDIKDKELIIKAIINNSADLSYLSEDDRQDRKLLKSLIKKNHEVFNIRFIFEYKDDKELLEFGFKIKPEIIKEINEILKKYVIDKDIGMTIVRLCQNLYCHLPEELQLDTDIFVHSKYV